jgi:zinc protease
MGLIAGASVTAGWATARPGVDLVRLETAFWEELERIGREPVSADELERAKALTEADELGALQSVQEKSDRLSMYATLFDDPGMINDILPRYLSTTAEEIQAVCADVFRADNRVVLTYVPAGTDAAPDAATHAPAA